MDQWKFKSAADLGLAPEERLKSLRREASLFEYLTGNLWRSSTSAYLRLMHRVTFLGREHLPQSLTFVMVANHTSHLDALCLTAMIPSAIYTRVFSVAAADTFFTTRAKSIFAALAINALPIDRARGGAGQATILGLRERLTEGDTALVLFPEGTRSRTGELGKFKKGIGMLVAGTPVPVVPCYIEGSFAAFPPGARFPRRSPIRVSLFPPITFDQVVDDEDGWQQVASGLEEFYKSVQSGSPSSGLGARTT